MKNKIGEYWVSAQKSMDSEQRENFQDELENLGVMQFEIVDSDGLYMFYTWFSKGNEGRLTLFHDPGDGNYIYAYKGTSAELCKLMQNLGTAVLERNQ